jgi:hypothetical protein
MQVSDIRVVQRGDEYELQARVRSEANSFDPFVLWYRVPCRYGKFLDLENGDPFVAALLLPAMATGETLKIPVPVSPILLRSVLEIQSILHCFDARYSRIEVRAPVRSRPIRSDSEGQTGLFFSLGVDSFYSLLRNAEDHPRDEAAITYLIHIHGFDLLRGGSDSEFPPTMLERSEAVARETGKSLLPVVTNLRSVSARLADWTMNHGAALASVALALGSMFRRVHIAASTTYDQLYPWGTHPVLDPLWSTERLMVVHDGCDVNRIDKTHFIADSSVVLETLRVCPGYGSAYNCGRCVKCLPTMIDLLLAGVLHRSGTLPHDIDPEALRHVLSAYRGRLNYENYQRRFVALRKAKGHEALQEVLAEYLSQGDVPETGGLILAPGSCESATRPRLLVARLLHRLLS